MDIKAVREADENIGDTLQGIVTYQRGDNLKLLLQEEENSGRLQLKVLYKQTKMGEFSLDNITATRFLKLLESHGFNSSSTIFCDLVYDGDQPGTYGAYRTVKGLLSELHENNGFKRLYVSETDISIGREVETNGIQE